MPDLAISFAVNPLNLLVLCLLVEDTIIDDFCVVCASRKPKDSEFINVSSVVILKPVKFFRFSHVIQNVRISSASLQKRLL